MCLGDKLEAAGWKVQTTTLSYGGTPIYFDLILNKLPDCRAKLF